jgi:hypothetical protein
LAAKKTLFSGYFKDNFSYRAIAASFFAYFANKNARIAEISSLLG